jgi:hypothetical protein
MARTLSGCEVLRQNFLHLALPDAQVDGIFANAAGRSFRFRVQSERRRSVLLVTEPTRFERYAVALTGPWC